MKNCFRNCLKYPEIKDKSGDLRIVDRENLYVCLQWQQTGMEWILQVYMLFEWANSQICTFNTVVDEEKTVKLYNVLFLW